MPKSFEVERQLSMMLYREDDHLVSAYEILVHHALTQVVLFAEKRAQPFAQHSCLCSLIVRAKNDRPDCGKRHRVGMASSNSRARKWRNVVRLWGSRNFSIALSLAGKFSVNLGRLPAMTCFELGEAHGLACFEVSETFDGFFQ